MHGWFQDLAEICIKLFQKKTQTLLAFVGIALVIISKWPPLSQRLLFSDRSVNRPRVSRRNLGTIISSNVKLQNDSSNYVCVILLKSIKSTKVIHIKLFTTLYMYHLSILNSYFYPSLFTTDCKDRSTRKPSSWDIHNRLHEGS